MEYELLPNVTLEAQQREGNERERATGVHSGSSGRSSGETPLDFEAYNYAG